MKILFLLSRIEKSGVALHTLDLTHGLVKRGHKITMITGGITDTKSSYLMELYQQFLDMGVEMKFFKTPKGNPFRKAFTSVFSIIKILQLISRTRADVIHSQSPYMTFLPWLLGKKYVSTVHNVQLVQNLKYKKPTKLIAISKESKDYAVDNLGAKAEDVHIVYHGVSDRYAKLLSEEDQIKLREKFQIKKENILIGFVGRITVEKGLDVLIEAVEKYLPTHMQERVQMIFLGSYFSESDELWLRDILKSSAISDKIQIVSFQDPRPLYNIFDIFVLPSNSEAFGLVCVEAMMCGCCTVRTDTNGAEDQIVDGEDGFIFPNRNSEALADILKKIITDPLLAQKVAERGRKKAMETFTIDAMTINTEKVYQTIS